MQKDTYVPEIREPYGISNEKVMEYATLYMKEFGEGISAEEARIQIRKLIMLYEVLLRD